ncbi:helix-turn-helix domain-containing protein [Pseudarthrobacter sp. J75]|uniref:winged helix-turn-helix transcriptional regulator n=1 Tax=unclassified Pseudarthrobacter TaxID=2647000 RepID=UPI002E81FEFE|nr:MULTISPECIES: helix-turn-helix domain-containing protein [unclassified Pseudarthrobacter]MEE2524172.1 helix-turn-helix domain-containing protein [Pseudarthrobacter sp. J47]MEE2530210.1 helix-turn-helix domain-containing protein [Pseudarthrobacter sp. J75]
MPDTSTSTHPEVAMPPAHRELIGQILDKWSLSVLNELCNAPCRFNDLRRAIPDVSQKSLTTTLRRLERNGIIERTLLSSRPIAVEYRITPLGKTVREPLDALLLWASASLPAIEKARDAFDGDEPSSEAPAGTGEREIR